ncbi:hypothetical protein, partial [Rhizobium sp. Leaf371]|uniref:hypothetical protein n=1 Tax=Rhizobium sp. Leaf371 TaxID=1736355 RepID=UPI001AEC4769
DHSRAPAENMQGTVETWVNSQWKYNAAPGQLSVEINSLSIRRLSGAGRAMANRAFDSPFC